MDLRQQLKKLHMDDPAQRKREIAWLWKQMKQHRGAIVLISIVSICGILLGLGGSVASKQLIDSITGLRLQGTVSSASVFAAMLLGSMALGALSSHKVAKLRSSVRNDLQQKVFQKVMGAKWESLEGLRSGDLLNLFSADVTAVSDGIINFLPGLLGNLLRILGTLGIMFFYEPTMALIALLGVPVTFLLSRVLSRKMRSYSMQMKEMTSDVLSFQEDSFRNLTSIKAFSVTELFSQELDRLQQRQRQVYLDANAFQLGMSALVSLAGMAITAAGFCYGVYRLWQGALTYGALTMLLQLANTLRSAFSALVSLLHSGVNLSVSAGRLMSVEELPGEGTDDPEILADRAVSVRMEQVSFAYQDGDVVLHPFDFYTEPGDVIAITGPSGEGKTTLLRLLLGLVEPKSGKAWLSGTKAYPIGAGTRRAFSYVPQGNSIFAGTVAQNLRLFCPEATDEELCRALDAACALEFVEQLPGKLEHPLGAGGRGLSEGQAQRLAIARALLRGAPILLLDEATSALDVATEQQILKNLLLRDWARTCILVTHRPASAEICSRGYEIHDGTVTEVR